MTDISKITINSGISLLEALKTMDSRKVKVLFVFDGLHFEGLLTIGDIQRAIIRNVDLSDPVSNILDRNKIYGYVTESDEQVKEKMRSLRAEVMPILDSDGNLVDVWFWNDLFGTVPDTKPKIDVPVVIMAGGQGSRLKPITNVIPKPLIPIGEKTILEVIMDQFESIGCHKFYLSVKYKADIIQYYLGQLEHKYDIEFIHEHKPLGTIGSVSKLKGRITTPFFVSNCDSINEQDYRDVYQYHLDNKNDITIVTTVKSIKIPYGVVETGECGLMTALMEKPEQVFQVNTGVYILNPSLIEDIPEGEFFHITNLIDLVNGRGGRVGCFPVSERSWRDMGEWPEYLKMIKVL